MHDELRWDAKVELSKVITGCTNLVATDKPRHQMIKLGWTSQAVSDKPRRGERN